MLSGCEGMWMREEEAMTMEQREMINEVARLKLERDILALEVEKLKERLALLEAVEEESDG